jgi:hypothetical protein
LFSAAHNRSLNWHREAAIALLLALLAFAIRVYRVDFNSLSEDEVAKWSAIQDYRHGHFVGVNSEHPMLPKMLAWASLSVGEHWTRLAAGHGWPSMGPEGWLRLPYVVFGALTAALLYFFCRQMMGVVGSLAASFFWAVAPLPVALNRLAKEETPLTFFTLLACYFYCLAKQATSDTSTRRWYDLSAIGFGLAFASQYILHLFGMNQLAWHLAGRAGLDGKPFASVYKRFFLIVFLTFIIVDPVFLFPSNFVDIIHWVRHGGVRHSGYDFNGTLYMNFPGRFFAGVPWYFYIRLLLVKTPIPILVAIIIGSILLLRGRPTLATCFFFALGAFQLIALSVSGAKWIRYSLPLLPFFYLAGGYAVQEIWKRLNERKVSLAFVGLAAVALFAWPLLEVRGWSPYYPFYLNSIGGGKANIAHYFAPDEVSEFDTREVAQQVCPSAAPATRLATARPMSMSYYLESCGRTDIQVVPLYDARYTPTDGDWIILEPSRRFFETQRFFDVLEQSRMSHREVHVGPIMASTIYQVDRSLPAQNGAQEQLALNQHGESRGTSATRAPHTKTARTSNFALWRLW